MLFTIELGLISQKSGIRYIFSDCFAKIKVNSYDSLPIEKRLTLKNVTIHANPALNEDKNQDYSKIFLVKLSYQLARKRSQILADSIIMVKFGEKETAEERFYAKIPIKSVILMLII